MSSKTFFGTPRKFCGMCGVVGIKDSPIIITYYFLFVKFIWRADVMKVIFFNEKDDDYGVIVREWMGPVAQTPANPPIY